jgi:tetratricopeptide (TPR) repeat protein
MRRVLLLPLVLLFSVATPVVAQTLFERGTDAFLYNQPQQAIQIFEQVVASEPGNARAYLYLAMSYEQLGRHEQALTVLRRAETVPGIDRATVKFNIGNNLSRLDQLSEAINAYGQAISLDPLSTSAFLNRANAYVQTEAYADAVADYRTVLSLDPNHRQRVEIERMIALLDEELERQRIAEEEERRAAELAEQRRRALLNNVLDSIRTSTEDTENMSAGNEEIDTFEEDDFDIADDE